MTTNNFNEQHSGWSQYYRVNANRPPREFLARSIRRFEVAGTAIDLGCGTGPESIYLAQRGWHVLAIDQNESAIQELRASATPDIADHLQTLIAPFEALELPLVDLVWAGLSLPFCQQYQFDTLWHKACSALNPGGRFVGDLFGSRHAWLGKRDMTFHTKEQVLSLCDGLRLEYIVEEEGDQRTANDGVQHWHMFSICALKSRN